MALQKLNCPASQEAPKGTSLWQSVRFSSHLLPGAGHGSGPGKASNDMQ